MAAFAPHPPGNAPALAAEDVTEETVDGRRVLIIDGERWPEVRPRSVFITSMPDASSKERGYIIFRRAASDEVFETSAPRRGEQIGSLETIIAPGEKRHVQFAVYALKDLGHVRMAATPLRSSSGTQIDAEVLDIRVVKSVYRRAPDHQCHRVPHLLIKQEDAPPVAQGLSRQFWITIAVPPQTPAGAYRGRIALSAEKGGAAGLDLSVQVPDLALVEPGWWGMYYYGGWNGNITKRVFADMLDHGMTGILYCDGKTQPGMKKVGERAELDLRAADQCMPLLREMGFREVVYYPRLLSNKLIMLFDMAESFKPHSGIAAREGEGVRHDAVDLLRSLRSQGRVRRTARQQVWLCGAVLPVS